jgi:hypothetical protein
MPCLRILTLKVDQQPHADLCELHVGQELGDVDARNRVDALQLDDQTSFHEQIDATAAVEPNTLVPDRQGRLLNEGDSGE